MALAAVLAGDSDRKAAFKAPAVVVAVRTPRAAFTRESRFNENL